MNNKILFGIVGILTLIAAYMLMKNTNSVSTKSISVSANGDGNYKTALFAGGCFWSLESYFEKAPVGIVDAVSGYSGGKSENPAYKDYSGKGHREVVQVTYDPAKISYGELTEYFFRHIDPTDAGGAFYDRGANYTTAIYSENADERKIAEEIIKILDSKKIFEKPIVTAILPLSKFWPAEDYHQNYAKNNSLKYTSYRIVSGRDTFLKKVWEGKDAPMYKDKVMP